MIPQIKVRQQKGRIVTLALDGEITQVAFKFGPDAHARFFADWIRGGSSVALTLGTRGISAMPSWTGTQIDFFLFVRSRGLSQSRGSYSRCPFFRTVVPGRFGYRVGVADGRLRRIRERYSWVRGRMRRVHSHCNPSAHSQMRTSVRC